ncbi:MAG: hypothetical protein Q9227_000080 [Pyrenula ochraceoflavens]
MSLEGPHTGSAITRSINTDRELDHRDDLDNLIPEALKQKYEFEKPAKKSAHRDHEKRFLASAEFISRLLDLIPTEIMDSAYKKMSAESMPLADVSERDMVDDGKEVIDLTQMDDKEEDDDDVNEGDEEGNLDMANIMFEATTELQDLLPLSYQEHFALPTDSQPTETDIVLLIQAATFYIYHLTDDERGRNFERSTVIAEQNAFFDLLSTLPPEFHDQPGQTSKTRCIRGAQAYIKNLESEIEDSREDVLGD